MAVKREKLSRAVGSAQASDASLASGSQPGSEPTGGDTDDLRIRQLRARDMLRGDLEGEELDKYVEERVLTTTMDKAVAWARSNALFPATFGLACCAIEMMSIVAARVDVARFGFEAFRASPRQADLLILSGRISIKMAPIVRRIYDQMLEPKWAIAMGACSSSMGVFNNYAIVPADKFMPVDVHVPGCPPRPEALMHGILKLRKMIQEDPDMGWRDGYGARGTEEVVPDESDTAGTAVNVFLPRNTAGA
jgi:NADH-quinone oxidoreductase subunit B